MKNKYFEYVEPKLSEIGQMIAEGLTEKQIAVKLGIGYTTFREYKQKYPALLAVLKKNADARNECVERSLYKRATGETVTIKKPVKVKRVEYDPTTGKKLKEYEEVETVEEQQYIPPDTAANIFWCVNHMGDKYKNNPHQVKINEKKLKLAEKKQKDDNW